MCPEPRICPVGVASMAPSIGFGNGDCVPCSPACCPLCCLLCCVVLWVRVFVVYNE